MVDYVTNYLEAKLCGWTLSVNRYLHSKLGGIIPR